MCSCGCNVMHLGDIIIQEKAVIGQKINKIYELLIKEVCCILVHNLERSSQWLCSFLISHGNEFYLMFHLLLICISFSFPVNNTTI